MQDLFQIKLRSKTYLISYCLGVYLYLRADTWEGGLPYGMDGDARPLA